MANLTVSGDSDYSSTGTPDTFTAISDGPSGTDALAAHINGIATAVTELQALLGNALTLKGSVSDLVTRLSRVIQSDGALAKGTSFPGTPIDGQPFYRTDLNTLYIYDAGTTSWTLGLDDGTFALIDGTRDFTGDIKVRKSTPSVRLCGTESSANDVLIREDTGVLYFYKNTGSEGTPSWTEFFNINCTTGALTTLLARLTGSGSYKAILTHANTADRTYTLPNFNWDFITGTVFKGPTSCGAGSTRSHEGSLTISGNQNLSGIHFYSDFTIDAGVTVTVPAGKRRLVIIASGTITINGTITASGAGGVGGTSGGGAGNGGNGGDGTDQAGGGGGGNTGANSGGSGGRVLRHGIVLQDGGSGAVGSGAGATQLTASDLGGLLALALDAMGSAGGGGSYDTAGGAGGGSIVLIAPTVILASTATLNTSGVAPNSATYGAGSGSGGNVYVFTRSYTDGGATFTLTGGSADAGSVTSGGAGVAGVKQINIYS